jgi:hypothetical protein
LAGSAVESTGTDVIQTTVKISLYEMSQQNSTLRAIKLEISTKEIIYLTTNKASDTTFIP